MRELPVGEHRAELDDLIDRGLEMLGGFPEVGDFFPDDLDDADQVVDAIRGFVDGFRTRARDRDPEQVAFAIGAMWGDELRRAMGWTWVLLQLDGGPPLFGLVSPDRAVAIQPQVFVFRILIEPGTDNSTALLFDMLRAGTMPPGAPGSYALVG